MGKGSRHLGPTPCRLSAKGPARCPRCASPTRALNGPLRSVVYSRLTDCRAARTVREQVPLFIPPSGPGRIEPASRRPHGLVRERLGAYRDTTTNSNSMVSRRPSASYMSLFFR